ncbi:caspase family protein [Streptomyces sp. 15-116A]|uniref:caspase family protein n=1 Tax=Streptomyces sp. 15-116A TaxID=2259035 RepID=UPI0021B47467|nr:caspase family protein [Streptomyces sp. 15-116A]MCT7353866.1 caspase family protein [Streptomyces sp. 15-116A]
MMPTTRPEPGPPAGSHALLIGVPEYEHPEFTPIPAVRNSLQAVRDLLCDEVLCGWKSHQVTVIDDVPTASELAVQVADLAEKVTGNLLLYYVGHGMLSPAGELCLVMPGTRPDRPTITGLAWGHVAEALRLSPAKARITILDCCFAGRAIEALTTDGQALADLAFVQGAYTLTATSRNRTAHVPPLSEQDTRSTSFTGQLCDLVRCGIPGKAAHLTFNDIYPVLRARLHASGLPVPNQRGTDTAGQIVFARNAASAPVSLRAEPTISGNPVILESGGPFEERVDRVVAAWAARGQHGDWLVNGTAFFALYMWWHDREQMHQASPIIHAYVESSYESLGGKTGWDHLLHQRVRCACHDEFWRMENINICLGCLRYQCYLLGRECEACGGRIVG